MTIGATSVTQEAADSKKHIAGLNYPMFGKAQNVGKSQNPSANMSHLSALVAVKVVNEGFGGDILVKDVEFSIPEIINEKGTVTQQSFPLVGKFSYNIANGSFTDIENETSHAVRNSLPSSIAVEKNNSVTFYIAVRPCSLKGKTVSIKINGSERSILITKDINLESGKVTTFKVPVKALEAEHVKVENGVIVSDAFRVTSTGREAQQGSAHTTGNVITVGNPSKRIKVNGQDVEAYILGSTDGKTGTITITGFLKDMINALPVKFYASTWNDKPAVMTVNRVSVWIPSYERTDTLIETVTEGNNKRTQKVKLTTKFNNLEKRGDLLGFKDSPFTLERWMILLVGQDQTATESKITFSNIAPNGHFDDNYNIVVLNEGFTQKEVNDGNLDSFLESFTIGSGDAKKTATAAGLRKLANIDIKDIPSEYITEETRKQEYHDGFIFDYWDTKEVTTEVFTTWPVDENGNYTIDSDIINTIEGIWGKISPISIADVVKATDQIPSKFHLLHMLRDVKVSIELKTTNAGPCIVFWGLDAYTPADREADKKASNNQ